jgi:membrane protein insertase Oxa1/YidC/SpoIIIJ
VRQQQLHQSQQQQQQQQQQRQRYFSSDTAASTSSTSSSSSALVPTSESTMTDVSTMTTLEQVVTSILPPSIAAFTTKLSFWGMTGLLLTNFHTTLHIPYWACISLTNILIRSAMIPIVIHGAKTQVKLGSVSPEVQYLLTSFTTDMTTLGKAGQGKTVGQNSSDYYVNQLYKGRIILIKATMETLRGIYRMKDINPLAIFKVRDGNK